MQSSYNQKGPSSNIIEATIEVPNVMQQWFDLFSWNRVENGRVKPNAGFRLFSYFGRLEFAFYFSKSDGYYEESIIDYNSN